MGARPAPGDVAAAVALVARVVTRLRAVVAALYPTPLEFIGQAPVLEILLRNAERACGLSCVLTPAQGEALYEVVAQVVANTLRHAAETIAVAPRREGANAGPAARVGCML